MNLQVLYQWIETVDRHFPRLKKWQAMGLALFSYGIVVAEACQVSKVAEALAVVGRIPTVERRLRRWLNNDGIEIGGCGEAWIKWVWSACDLPRAILLVDEIKLGDRIGVMMVSLAYGGRAIPLVWRCYWANSAPDYPAQGQVLLVWGLLARVVACLPVEARPLAQMDRGLGHSSAMLRALQTLPLQYLVRVKATARLTTRRGHTCLLRDLVKPGETCACWGALFTRHRQVWTHVHLIWDAGQAEPWCLVTNDPTVRAAGYAVRMWQEESFRDLKSGGWQWQRSQVGLPRRADRLILALALAYAWMLTQGTLVAYADPSLQREVCADRRNKYSLFRSGLRFFKRMAQVDGSKIFVGLFFAPPFKPSP
jgi:hypothetical protein